MPGLGFGMAAQEKFLPMQESPPAARAAGQSQADHIQTEKEIFAEVSAFDGLLQILVGGGNDSDIHRHESRSADTMKFPILKHPRA